MEGCSLWADCGQLCLRAAPVAAPSISQVGRLVGRGGGLYPYPGGYAACGQTVGSSACELLLQLHPLNQVGRLVGRGGGLYPCPCRGMCPGGRLRAYAG
jgi:hypothetical protein